MNNNTMNNNNYNGNYNGVYNNYNYNQTQMWQQPQQQLPPNLDQETIKNINYFMKLSKLIIIFSIVAAAISLVVMGIVDDEAFYIIMPISAVVIIGWGFLYSNSIKNNALLLYQTYKINQNLISKQNEKKK